MKYALLLLLVACDELLPPGDGFVAMQEDFANYRRWHRYETEGDIRLGEGARQIYLNHRPDRGRAEFPVGTKIVKVAESDEDPTTWLMVAMAKRGGDYNADGAVGWEWFDLDLSPEGTPMIDWRGPVPPEGSGYECALGEDEPAGETIGDCNTCHQAAADNDFVLAPPLALSDL